MNKKLHIISFDIPYPPNYGGIIDVFYKIRALHEAGTEIILHCFEYNREQAEELNKICSKIYYYERKRSFLKQLSLYPFIVKTRNHQNILKNILAEPAPILFEGLHSCYFLDHPKLISYTKLVRTHNIEHEYYHYLWKSEKDFIRKIYFLLESMKLKLFEKKLAHANYILPISMQDTEYFEKHYDNIILLPAFHPFVKLSTSEGRGDYVIFHGNLSVSENLKSIDFLIEKVFSEITVPFIIAGKNPPEWLLKKIKNIPHISMEANPNAEKMEKLINHSQICLIPTFQATGLKLKLLTSFFAGRHCITNTEMVHGTGLEELCHIGNSPEEIINLTNRLISKRFTKEDIQKRKNILEKEFSNRLNAQKIIDLI